MISLLSSIQGNLIDAIPSLLLVEPLDWIWTGIDGLVSGWKLVSAILIIEFELDGVFSPSARRLGGH